MLNAGGEGDIYRIIISEYPVSGLSSYLGINITNDNVVTTCGWDWDTERTHNNYGTPAHTNVIPAVKQRKYFQLKLIRSKNQDDILSIVTSREGLWVREQSGQTCDKKQLKLKSKLKEEAALGCGVFTLYRAFLG